MKKRRQNFLVNTTTFGSQQDDRRAKDYTKGQKLKK